MCIPSERCAYNINYLHIKNLHHLTYGRKNVLLLLDKANTSTYGNTEYTKVNIGVCNRPHWSHSAGIHHP